MRKDDHISFRASKELHQSLTRVAREDKRSLSSTIEIALTNFLKERKAFKGIGKEKRQYPRKALSISAAINQQESGQMGIGAITDISLGGLRLLIPKDFKHQILMAPPGSRFEIIFNLPADNKPIRLSCELNRVVDCEEGIQIGASVVDADFKSYKILQNYLM